NGSLALALIGQSKKGLLGDSALSEALTAGWILKGTHLLNLLRRFSSLYFLICSLIILSSHLTVETKGRSQRNRMKITFERSGGVGGFRLSAEVDTDSKQLIFGATRSAKTLSADEVRDLEKIVKAADFFSLPDVSFPRGKSSDPFQYVITIESGRQRRTIRTT